MLLSLRVITCFGSFPASGGPPLGGRAGERVARMLLAFCPFVPFHLSYWRSIAEAIANAIERPIERHIDNPRQKQSNSAPSLRSVVAALRDAQTFRGSAPSGFQGSDSLREPPPSFLTCALNGLVSKIHPRARPAKPDQPAFCNCATSRCGPLSLS